MTIMTKLEEVEQKIADNGISVIEITELNTKSVIIEDENFFIGINGNLIKDKTDKTIALSHELGHYNTGGLSLVKLPFVNKSKLERLANLNSVRHLLPAAEILEAVHKGRCAVGEIAEEVGLPDEYVDMAIRLYRQSGELPLQ